MSEAHGNERGLFLDLDGTLADSLSVLRSVYEDFLRSFGKQASEDEFQRLNGPPLVQIIASLKETHSLNDDAAVLQALYLARMKDAYQNAPPVKGALEMVEKAHKLGWIVAVVTSAHKAPACDWLACNGLLEFMTDVVGGDEVVRGKPNPEPYALALVRSGCAPRLSLAVEDSRAGATAAIAAGLRTFVIAAANDRDGWPQDVHFLCNLSGMLEHLGYAQN